MPMDTKQVHEFVETSTNELREGIQVLSDNFNQWKNFMDYPYPRHEVPSLPEADVKQAKDDRERLTRDITYLKNVKAALQEKNAQNKENTALEEEFKKSHDGFIEKSNYKVEVNNWLENYKSYLDNTVKMMDEELDWVRQFCRTNNLPLSEILEDNVKTEQMEH
ncbi:hypothetical protein Ddc_10924 [Ditylenchus destructor]|nr:hypothetical protein Ddc_10924 [Ditylenchus destructor]